MPEESKYVIIGASLAGAKAAQTLREEGFGGTVLLVGAEQERPYERPPLSKGFLLGKEERSKIYVHDEGWYGEHEVDLRLGVTARSVDRAARRIELSDGQLIGYDKLLITTGASPRRLNVPGADLDGVLYLRTVADSERLAATLRSQGQVGGRVVIVGAGWIGLETAAARVVTAVRSRWWSQKRHRSAGRSGPSLATCSLACIAGMAWSSGWAWV